MKETAVAFGERSGLQGVISAPDRMDPEAHLPGLVILNSGLLHKAGPSRLGVEMARTAANRGFPVLRFDLSGIGDSRMLTTNVSARERAVGDVRSAMDLLGDRFGSSQFILAGLCSGSDNAHYTSLQDSRVVGTIHVDGYCVKNPQYYLRYYGGRLLSMRALQNRLRPSEARQLDARTREYPSLEVLTAHFTTLTARGVRFLYIYTGESDVYNHEGQLREVLPGVPFGALLEEQYYPLAAHTLTSLVSRSRAVERVTDWMTSHWLVRATRDGAGSCRTGTIGDAHRVPLPCPQSQHGRL